jgi:hypothetical protein
MALSQKLRSILGLDNRLVCTFLGPQIGHREGEIHITGVKQSRQRLEVNVLKAAVQAFVPDGYCVKGICLQARTTFPVPEQSLGTVGVEYLTSEVMSKQEGMINSVLQDSRRFTTVFGIPSDDRATLNRLSETALLFYRQTKMELLGFLVHNVRLSIALHEVEDIFSRYLTSPEGTQTGRMQTEETLERYYCLLYSGFEESYLWFATARLSSEEIVNTLQQIAADHRLPFEARHRH